MAGYTLLFVVLSLVVTVNTWTIQSLLREHIRLFSEESSNTQNKYVMAAARRNFAPAIVTNDCLDCLCRMESGCEPVGCKEDGSCGYFMIKESYWRDCGELGRDFRTCANNITCSSECVQRYMERYARQQGCSINCEGFAREQDGGAYGCTNPSTLPFWEKLQELPGCKGVQ